MGQSTIQKKRTKYCRTHLSIACAAYVHASQKIAEWVIQNRSPHPRCPGRGEMFNKCLKISIGMTGEGVFSIPSASQWEKVRDIF